jgi:hypothetical protein
VWIYQSDRKFLESEAAEINEKLSNFASQWKSHGDQVQGFGKLLYGMFIILMADETVAGVSGCSTDSSVRLIKEIEQQYQVNLFDRHSLCFVVNDELITIPLSHFETSIQNETLTGDTLYFNNLVLTKQELLSNWVIPVKDSWLKGRMKIYAER